MGNDDLQMLQLENVIMRQRFRAKGVDEDLKIDFKKIHELFRVNERLEAKLRTMML